MVVALDTYDAVNADVQPRNYGQRIEEERAKKGMSQEDLAAVAVLSRYTVQKAERDDPSVSMKSIWKIARVFDLTPNDLDASAPPRGRDRKHIPDELLDRLADRAEAEGYTLERWLERYVEPTPDIVVKENISRSGPPAASPGRPKRSGSR